MFWRKPKQATGEKGETGRISVSAQSGDHTLVKTDDLADLLFCAVAYALPRESYMVKRVMELVREYAPFLAESTRWKLGSWIEFSLDLAKDLYKDSWLELARWLKGEEE